MKTKAFGRVGRDDIKHRHQRILVPLETHILVNLHQLIVVQFEPLDLSMLFSVEPTTSLKQNIRELLRLLSVQFGFVTLKTAIGAKRSMTRRAVVS